MTHTYIKPSSNQRSTTSRVASAAGRLGSSPVVWNYSGLESTWLETAHLVEVDRHPLYTRVREIVEAGEGIGRDSVGAAF